MSINFFGELSRLQSEQAAGLRQNNDHLAASKGVTEESSVPVVDGSDFNLLFGEHAQDAYDFIDMLESKEKFQGTLLKRLENESLSRGYVIGRRLDANDKREYKSRGLFLCQDRVARELDYEMFCQDRRATGDYVKSLSPGPIEIGKYVSGVRYFRSSDAPRWENQESPTTSFETLSLPTLLAKLALESL